MSRESWRIALEEMSARISRLQTQVVAVTALPLARVQRTRHAVAPLATGSVDVTLTWPATWPDPVRYQVVTTIIATGSDIGQLVANFKAGTATATDVVVTVVNTGVAQTAAFTLDVLGIQGV